MTESGFMEAEEQGETHRDKIRKKDLFCTLDLISPIIYLAFLMAQMVKNPAAMQEIWVQYLGQDDSLE